MSIILHPSLVVLCFSLHSLLIGGISVKSYNTAFTTATQQCNNNVHNESPVISRPRRPFRLVTWNLLAPIYSPPNKYTWCDPLYLEWSHREPLIVERLRSMQADVVCLQEVQIDIWNNGLEQCLQEQLGYTTTLLQNVTNQHPVATAILIHQDCGIRLRRAESRSRVLLAVLEVPSSSSTTTTTTGPLSDDNSAMTSSSYDMLYLANVHLDAGAGPEHDITRFHQIKSLLKRLNYHVQLDQSSIRNHNNNEKDKQDVKNSKHPAVIICGDFNFVSPHPLSTFLETGKYIEDDSLSSSSSSLQSFSSNLLPLQNVFSQHPLAMTYGSGRVLDYIWASPNTSFQILETTGYYPSSSSSTENEDELMQPCRPQPWPSANHPSDHIPIGALLRHSVNGGEG